MMEEHTGEGGSQVTYPATDQFREQVHRTLTTPFVVRLLFLIEEEEDEIQPDSTQNHNMEPRSGLLTLPVVHFLFIWIPTQHYHEHHPNCPYQRKTNSENHSARGSNQNQHDTIDIRHHLRVALPLENQDEEAAATDLPFHRNLNPQETSTENNAIEEAWGMI
jgi:hypothetical protein